MAKKRGSKPKHAPGYVCFKKDGTSKAQKDAARRKAAEIAAGKEKKKTAADVKLMERKTARVGRQEAARQLEMEKRFRSRGY